MTLLEKLRTRTKLQIALVAILTAITGWIAGALSGGQAIAAIVSAALGYMGAQGYVDGKAVAPAQVVVAPVTPVVPVDNSTPIG